MEAYCLAQADIRLVRAFRELVLGITFENIQKRFCPNCQTYETIMG